MYIYKKSIIFLNFNINCNYLHFKLLNVITAIYFYVIYFFFGGKVFIPVKT
jgi:hypothetical protein